jgi:cobalt/nickel transport system ATP-binding protein
VIITEPDVLLLDEPTAALDPQSRADLVAFLGHGLGAGRTVIAATHDLDIIDDISERTIVLDQGKVAADGPTLDILHDIDLLRRTHLVFEHHHTHGHAHDHPHGAHGHIHQASES